MHPQGVQWQVVDFQQISRQFHGVRLRPQIQVIFVSFAKASADFHADALHIAVAAAVASMPCMLIMAHDLDGFVFIDGVMEGNIDVVLPAVQIVALILRRRDIGGIMDGDVFQIRHRAGQLVLLVVIGSLHQIRADFQSFIITNALVGHVRTSRSMHATASQNQTSRTSNQQSFLHVHPFPFYFSPVANFTRTSCTSGI